MKLLIFGYGYSARYLVAELAATPGSVRVTTRSADKAAQAAAEGLTPRIFPGTDMADDIAWASHILITAGPEDGQDPVLAHARDAIAAHAKRLDWVGYLSTTGVYGDHGGAWVDEATPLTPLDRTGPRAGGSRDRMDGPFPSAWPAAAYLSARGHLRAGARTF